MQSSSVYMQITLQEDRLKNSESFFLCMHCTWLAIKILSGSSQYSMYGDTIANVRSAHILLLE